ncbi:hypothetical protein EBB07_28640 [Paenibacillaceae bacterium]|nr:hypothetical protein EBB07_28640 [Paenibacillaceae bacterium]
MSNHGKWTFSGNEEFFNEGKYFDTKEQAIEEGKQYFEKDYYNSFYVAQVEEVGNGATVDVDSILEHITDSMFDELGEVAEDYLSHVKTEHYEELELQLVEVIDAWINKYNYNPTFFIVANTERIDMDV